MSLGFNKVWKGFLLVIFFLPFIAYAENTEPLIEVVPGEYVIEPYTNRSQSTNIQSDLNIQDATLVKNVGNNNYLISDNKLKSNRSSNIKKTAIFDNTDSFCKELIAKK